MHPYQFWDVRIDGFFGKHRATPEASGPSHSHDGRAGREHGNRGKAAEHHPTRRFKTIAELESAVGVRLFDRSPQGAEPTACGRALLHCSATVFDNLRQGVRNIEFLNNPTLGEVRIGTDEPQWPACSRPCLDGFTVGIPASPSTWRIGGVRAAAAGIARAKDRPGDWKAGLECRG